jgi:hypothetical protein
MMQQPQQQPQLAGQIMGGVQAQGFGGQPAMQSSGLSLLGRPASTGVMMGQVSGQGGMGHGFGMSAGGDVDTSNMTLPQLQQLLRQRQAQQQQQQMGFGAGGMGGFGAMGGAGGVLRPTSLQDHLTGGVGGMAPDTSQWRPALGAVPSATGMQGFVGSGEGLRAPRMQPSAVVAAANSVGSWSSPHA